MLQIENVIFGPFRLDVRQKKLWRGEQEVVLRPRSFAFLRYLAEHPGRVITKQELRRTVWAGIHISDTVLRVCIQEVRKALGDSAAIPQFIETVPRIGYRFLTETSHASTSRVPFVGREQELSQLHTLWQKALEGNCQIVFVSGAPGSGKTTLAEQFEKRLLLRPQVRIGWGQCIEQSHEGEPYLPVLGALGQLCDGRDNKKLLALLRSHAPMWLLQLPKFVDDAEEVTLRQRTAGMNQGRMLRELFDVLTTFTTETGVVLVLDDLQWSDPSTIEFLLYVGRQQRRSSLRLMIIGLYRSSEPVSRNPVLSGAIQELAAHEQCEQIQLESLGLQEVNAYIQQRFSGQSVPQALVPLIYRHSDGNPLFVYNLVRYFITQRLLVEAKGQWVFARNIDDTEVFIPERVQNLIEKQINQFSSETQRILETASLCGDVFTSALVAAVLERSLEDVEAQCDVLARQRLFLRSQGRKRQSDGIISGQYRFEHALYRQCLSLRLEKGRQIRLHSCIGKQKESLYKEQVRGHAVELGGHFEAGWEYPRAVDYWHQAAEHALTQSAPYEAMQHCRHALALLGTQPETSERLCQEFALQTTLGLALTLTEGPAAKEVERAYLRAWTLRPQVSTPVQDLSVFYGLWSFRVYRGEYQLAEELSWQYVQEAERSDDPLMMVAAHWMLGSVLSWHGHSVPARVHLEQSLALSTPEVNARLIPLMGQDIQIFTLVILAHALTRLGYGDQARRRVEEALALARHRASPFSLSQALSYAMIYHQMIGEVDLTEERAEELLVLAQKQGFAYQVLVATAFKGWVMEKKGWREAGRRQIAQSITALSESQTQLGVPYLRKLLAESLGESGQPEAGLAVLAECLTEEFLAKTGNTTPQLYIAKGKLLLQLLTNQYRTSVASEAEESFAQALQLTRDRGEKWVELQAVMGLSQLWQLQGKNEEARNLLAEISEWFTEGFDVPDLQQAIAWLQEWARTRVTAA